MIYIIYISSFPALSLDDPLYELDCTNAESPAS